MNAVTLRLEGPLQAWGTQSKLGVRATDREPSKSGVLGMVGAALGMAREDQETLQTLARLKMAVRVDREGLLLRDYHTAGGGRFRGGDDYYVWDTGSCVPSDRYYLQDASFVVALSSDDEIVLRIASAVRSPRWPLYLGRRSCPPSEPVFIQVAAADARSAAHAAPLAGRADAGPHRLVVEVLPEENADQRYDVPLSFAEGERRYGIRYVRTEWVHPPIPVGNGEGGRP